MAVFQLRKKAKEEQEAEENQWGAQELGVETIAPVQPLLPPQTAKLPRQGGECGTVRLTMAVPRSLHTRLKLAAVRQERSIVSLVSGWIVEKTVVA